MEIRQLRAFVAVVEEGGLSAAARRLHVSQSALSQVVQVLERELGVQLLLRSNAGVTASPAGEVLLREAQSLLEHHAQVLAAVVDADAAARGAVLRIGVPLEFPAGLLPAALAHMNVRHPQTAIEVRHSSSSAQLTALRAHTLDVALVRDRPGDPRLDSALAVREAMGVILSDSCAAHVAAADGIPLHRLTGLRWAGFARSDSPDWYDEVRATLRGHGIGVGEPEGNGERPVTAEVKLAAVATGRVFALAAPGWSQPLPQGMVWSTLVDNPVVRRTWVVWHAHSTRRDLATLVAALDASASS